MQLEALRTLDDDTKSSLDVFNSFDTDKNGALDLEEIKVQRGNSVLGGNRNSQIVLSSFRLRL